MAQWVLSDEWKLGPTVLAFTIAKKRSHAPKKSCRALPCRCFCLCNRFIPLKEEKENETIHKKLLWAALPFQPPLSSAHSLSRQIAARCRSKLRKATIPFEMTDGALFQAEYVNGVYTITGFDGLYNASISIVVPYELNFGIPVRAIDAAFCGKTSLLDRIPSRQHLDHLDQDLFAASSVGNM